MCKSFVDLFPRPTFYNKHPEKLRCPGLILANLSNLIKGAFSVLSSVLSVCFNTNFTTCFCYLNFTFVRKRQKTKKQKNNDTTWESNCSAQKCDWMLCYSL